MASPVSLPSDTNYEFALSSASPCALFTISSPPLDSVMFYLSHIQNPAVTVEAKLIFAFDPPTPYCSKSALPAYAGTVVPGYNQSLPAVTLLEQLEDTNYCPSAKSHVWEFLLDDIILFGGQSVSGDVSFNFSISWNATAIPTQRLPTSTYNPSCSSAELGKSLVGALLLLLIVSGI